MASVNRINQALAKVRGTSAAAIEAYSRPMRHLFPRARGKCEPYHAALLLSAVMRGSTTSAASNAEEVAGLIVNDGAYRVDDDRLFRTILESFDLQDGITFGEAVGVLIDREATGTLDSYVINGRGIVIEVDRYWTAAKISWHALDDAVEMISLAYKDVYGELGEKMAPRRPDGTFLHPIELTFASPFIFQARDSYGVDELANSRAHAELRRLRDSFSGTDLHGVERVHRPTLKALAEVFQQDEAV